MAAPSKGKKIMKAKLVKPGSGKLKSKKLTTGKSPALKTGGKPPVAKAAAPAPAQPKPQAPTVAHPPSGLAQPVQPPQIHQPAVPNVAPPAAAVPPPKMQTERTTVVPGRLVSMPAKTGRFENRVQAEDVPDLSAPREPAIVKLAGQSTGIMKPEDGGPNVAKAADVKAMVEGEVENLKEQLHNYLEICDSISGINWQPGEIIDLLHVLVRSLGFDTVSLAVIDQDKPDSFMQVVSRGYHTPPNADIFKLWEQCIVPDTPTINWSKLMNLQQQTDNMLAVWIVEENLHHLGYAPLHDGGHIFGFIVIAAHEKKTTSPFASTLLELCGGRLGLSLGVNRGGGGDWPQAILDTSREIRDQFTLLMGYVEMLREANKLSVQEIAELTDSCTQALAESIQLLDSMTAEAAKQYTGEGE